MLNLQTFQTLFRLERLIQSNKIFVKIKILETFETFIINERLKNYY